MSMTPVFAQYAPTYSAHEPYISAAEFAAAPTGLNLSQLVPGGSPEQNADALEQAIRQGSGAADEICAQTLAATMQTQAGPIRIMNDGTAQITCDQTPIVAVYGISVGSTIDVAEPVSSFTGLQIDRKVVTLPPSMLSTVGGWGFGSTNGYAALTYVAGFANSYMVGATTEGVQTMPLDGILGIAPGQTLSIFDPGQSETFIVQSVNAAAGTVTSTTPLQYAHAVGVRVSAMPDVIKQAVILLTTSWIKSAKNASLVIRTVTTTPTESQGAGGPTTGSREYNQASAMLKTFMRVI